MGLATTAVVPLVMALRTTEEELVSNPEHPGRSYSMASVLIILVVLAAIIFALLMGIHSFG